MLRALAIFFSAAAVVCMVVAVVGMVSGRPGAKLGGLVRALALACFVAAVVLNVAAH